MRTHGKDWLRVVYGRGLEPEAGRGGAASRMEIAVRQTPSFLDLAAAPRREQQVRVTVVPSDRGERWTLWLMEDGAGSAGAPVGRVWWRAAPGTWQPLTPARQCIAEGRGRVRLDVSLRLEGGEVSAPRLRFSAEPGPGAG